MARFLCTVWPFPGHLYPTLAVAHALRARGHEVAIYSGGAARATVEGEGFTFFPFRHVAAHLRRVVDGAVSAGAGSDDDAFYERLTARYAQRLHGKRLRGVLDKTQYVEMALGTVPGQVDDLEAIIGTWRPHVVLTEESLWAPYLILHETRRIPVAVFSFLAGCLIPDADGLPARPRTPALPWHARARRLLVARAANVLAADVRGAANALRRRYGLPALRGPVLAQAGRMPLYLVAAAPEYDYNRRDLPRSVFYVGPCLWDRPRGEEAPDWLADLPRDEPIVYVTEGTSHVVDAALLRDAARGLADLPLRAILTTGRRRDPAALGLTDLAANVRVERFVPHSDLFPRLNAVVTNGGSGTVRAALLAGLPMVIVPMEWDQFENARRVVAAGAGVRLEGRRCTPQALRAAVETVLSDPAFRDNAARLGAASARCGGPDRAAALLEELACDPADARTAGAPALGQIAPDTVMSASPAQSTIGSE